MSSALDDPDAAIEEIEAKMEEEMEQMDAAFDAQLEEMEAEREHLRADLTARYEGMIEAIRNGEDPSADYSGGGHYSGSIPVSSCIFNCIFGPEMIFRLITCISRSWQWFLP